MYDSEDDYDSDEEPEFLSEEEMEFLPDHHQDSPLGQKTKQSVWDVIDKAKLVHVQVSRLLMSGHVMAACWFLTFKCLQDQSLGAIQGILGCSRDTARKLLTHFQWDKEALFGMRRSMSGNEAEALTAVYSLTACAQHSGLAQAPWQTGARKLCTRQQV